MKNNLLFFTFCIVICFNSQAQIMIHATDYPSSLIGNDTLKETLLISPFPTLPSGTNIMWDLSSCYYRLPLYTDNRTTSVISEAQFADSTQINFSGYYLQSKIQKSVISNAYIRYGELIQRTVEFISGSSDSLVVDSQYVSFSTPDTIIKYPTTYLTNWNTYFNYTVNFHLSYSSIFINAPGYIKSYEHTIDTVTGWGKIRVISLNGTTPSPYINVLQVKSLTYTTDSFYLNGTLVPTSLLSLINLTQGRSDTLWEQNYYRPEEITPLAYVSFSANYDTAQFAQTHANRLYNEFVNSVINDNYLKIYPNPTSNKTFNIELPETIHSYTYELMDANGKIVLKNSIKGNKELVTLPNTLTQGIYFLRILENGVQYGVRGIDISGN